VAGDIDLRDDLDTERRCMGDDLANIDLRIEAADRLAPLPSCGRSGSSGPRRNADRRQLRIGLDLKPPRLVIGQVPMEDVELEPGEDVDQPLDVGDRIELAGDIEMASAPAVARLVRNRAGIGKRKVLGWLRAPSSSCASDVRPYWRPAASA
jgi:hypothetical protein